MDKAIKAMSQLFDDVVREAHEYVEQERKAVLDAKSLTETTMSGEVKRLQEQNAYLAQLLQCERVKSERARDELIRRISGLLGEFVMDRDRSLKDAFTDLSEGNEKAQGGLTAFSDDFTQRSDSLIARGKEWDLQLDKRSGENKRLRDGSLKVTLF